MAITINSQERRIGLALSGGGFRAAAFHLGVMRKLQSLGLFSSIDLLSCVSGGSIAGAFVALNWRSSTVLDELENYLATRSIAVSSVIGGILDPFESRLDKLAKTYDRDLFQGARLSALRSGPRVYINATNLSTGNMFFFVAGGVAADRKLTRWVNIQSALTAWASVPEASISQLLAKPTDRLSLTGFKLPHHGSVANISAALLGKLRCKHYLISTSGAVFRHPHARTVELLLSDHESQAKPRLHFNYLTETTTAWSDAADQKERGYEAFHPKGISLIL